MYASRMLRLSAFFVINLAWASVAQAQQPAPAASAPASNAMPSVSGTNQPSASPAFLLHEALQLLQQKQLDAALAKVNAAIQLDPQNVDGYGIRGGIYASQKQWDKAGQDYQRIIQLDANNGQAKFNLSEILFLQKKYDSARPGFVALEQDRDLKDLATYKVFLCDLFAGHEDVAAKELTSMDQVGSGASVYFGKAAWALVHKKPEEARGWLASAASIYSPNKFKLYSSSLYELGYLPLPPQ